jgi:hypothetical protein
MVMLAGVLLLAQLAPVLSFRVGAGQAAAARTALPGQRHGPGPLGGEFRASRLAPTEEGLVVDRVGGGTNFEVVGWQGTHDGTLVAPRLPGYSLSAWGDLQSPDGSRFVAGTLYLDIDGRSSDLRYLVEFGALTGYTWREDSQGACALTDNGPGTAALVQFVFNPGHATDLRFKLPTDFAGDAEYGPTVLWCNRALRTAAVGIVRPDGSAQVEVLDLVTGEDLGQRTYPRGSARSMMASSDGKLLAINGADPAHAGPGPTVVRDINSDRVLLDLGADTTVRSFSSDGSRILVDSPSHPGAAVLMVSGGARLWQDTSNRELLGWLARPFSPEFAIALGSRDARTCTRGEPLKFPQFCRFEALQDLEVVTATGVTLGIGRGVGAWGYTVR